MAFGKADLIKLKKQLQIAIKLVLNEILIAFIETPESPCFNNSAYLNFKLCFKSSTLLFLVAVKKKLFKIKNRII